MGKPARCLSLSRLSRLFLLFWLASAGTACAGAPRRQARPAGTTPVVRVMTYNVNFGIPGDGPTLDAIAEGRADVVLLQETNPAWEEALRDRFGARYPVMSFHHRGGAGGIGVLSRWPLTRETLLAAEGDGWFPALLTVVATPLGPMQVLSVHLRPPVSDGGSWVGGYFSSSRIHAAEMKTFSAALGSSLPTLVVGDFNEEDGRALEELRQRGFEDLLPSFAPKAVTWRWPLRFMTLEKMLDHILVDARWDPRAASVMEAGRSDHLPVLAELSLVEQGAPQPAGDVR